jgi:hypothetical protein
VSDQEQDADDIPWFRRREVVVVALRVVVIGLLALLAIHPRILATCVWTIVPLSLLEFHAARRDRPSFGLAVGVFLVAFLLLLAAYFQAIYAGQVIARGSISAGLDGVESELRDIFQEMTVVFIVFAQQCVAIAFAVVTLGDCPTIRRRKSQGARTVMRSWAGLSLLAPMLDWGILMVVGRSGIKMGELPILVGVSIFMLMLGSLVAAIVLFAIHLVVDYIAAAIVPAVTASRTEADRN